MIIFDLDGVLANNEHRRHYVDKYHPINFKNIYKNILNEHNILPSPDRPWFSDYQAYYDACDKDQLILQVFQVYESLRYELRADIAIWSGRYESSKDKTLKWLNDNHIYFEELKMRPIGNTWPDCVLKEMWLDELIINEPLGYAYMRHPIEMVFDANPDSIAMWRRRGIFCFDCRQE